MNMAFAFGVRIFLVQQPEHTTIFEILETNAIFAMSTDCIMCIVNKRDHCLSCGHRAFCQTCCEKIVRRYSRCPICRTPTNDMLKIIEV